MLCSVTLEWTGFHTPLDYMAIVNENISMKLTHSRFENATGYFVIREWFHIIDRFTQWQVLLSLNNTLLILILLAKDKN